MGVYVKKTDNCHTHIYTRIIKYIYVQHTHLHDPVAGGEVEPAGGHVGGEEHGGGALHEVEVDVRPPMWICVWIYLYIYGFKG